MRADAENGGTLALRADQQPPDKDDSQRQAAEAQDWAGQRVVGDHALQIAAAGGRLVGEHGAQGPRRSAHVALPVHPNPAVRIAVEERLGDVAGVSLLAPLGYREMVGLLERASIVMTDSGGLQEEAPALGKPVLVLRDVTERPEGVAAGTARLVGTEPERIVEQASALLSSPGEYALMARAVNPYGDGRAAQRIVAAVRGLPTAEFDADAAEGSSARLVPGRLG